MPLLALPGHPLCPVTAVINYISLTSQASSSGPAFVVYCNHKLVPLSPAAFTTKLRALLPVCGVCPDHFATHSFRRGGASWALQCGLPPDVVRMLGDWKSDSYLKYIDLTMDSRLSYVKTLSECLPRP